MINRTLHRAWLPLAPWAITAAFLLLAAAAFLLAARAGGASVSREFISFNAWRVSQFADSLGDDPYVVVLLGDSRLKYATGDQQSLATRLSAAIGRPARVLRVVNNLAVFNDFAPLTQALLGLDPDLVILQEDLMQNGRPLGVTLDLLRAHVLDGVLPGISPLVDDDVHTVQFAYPCWQSDRTSNDTNLPLTSTPRRGVSTLAMKLQLEQTRKWIVARPDGPSAKAARRFSDAMLSAGIQVAIVEVPPAPSYESFLRSSDQPSAARSREVRPLPTTSHRWSPPTQPTELYCDLTHLSPAGSFRFSEWLIQRIAIVANGVDAPIPHANARR